MDALECCFPLGLQVKNTALAFLWDQLRTMLAEYESAMVVTIDEPGYYRLYTPTKRPFMAVAIQKKHVGIYCMPLYEDNSLAGTLLPLKHGKGVIRFKSEHDPLLSEVPAFMKRCFERCITSWQLPSLH